jgi:tetratricopeptide (TPR) repeat protein
MILADDICFSALGWDDVLRRTAKRHPSGIFLAGPYDPTSADTCTYPIFGWKWLETLQKIFAGHFPYWYDDLWVHQIGEMAGCYERLPLDMHPIQGKGKTRRMRDLPFWARFFQLTLPEREAAARKLIAAMNLDPKSKESAERSLEKLAADFKGHQDKFSDLYAVFQEERFTMHTPEERRAFNPKHFEKETQAVARLMQIGQAYLSERKFEEALKCVDATFMSNIQLRQARDLKAQCLRALGRESEAIKLERQTLASWPEMNQARRLFRFLGMVASDGKTMILGFLQKGRKR